MPAPIPESRISGQPTKQGDDTRHGAANERASNGRKVRGGEPRRQIRKKRLLHHRRHGQKRRRIGADGHEADAAEIHDSGIAHEDIEADHGDEIDQPKRHASLKNDPARPRQENDHNHNGGKNDQGRASPQRLADRRGRGFFEPTGFGPLRRRHDRHTRSLRPLAGNSP